jgi:hypothetical protein
LEERFCESVFGENFLKKVFPKPLSKTLLRRKLPFARGISVFCTREACFFRAFRVLSFSHTPAKKVLVKLLQKLAVSKGRAFGSKRYRFLPVRGQVSPLARAFFWFFFCASSRQKKNEAKVFVLLFGCFRFPCTPANKVFARLFQKAAGCRGGALTKNAAQSGLRGDGFMRGAWRVFLMLRPSREFSPCFQPIFPRYPTYG